MQVRDHLPFNDREPFSRAEARAAGISAKLLKSARYRRLFYDLYVSSEVVVTPVVRAKAILKICPPGSQASHFTAAELWGAIVPSQPLTPSQLSAAGSAQRAPRRAVPSAQPTRGRRPVSGHPDFES